MGASRPFSRALARRILCQSPRDDTCNERCSAFASHPVRSLRKAPATQPVAAECFIERSGETNFRVRNCRIIHLKSLDHLGLLVVFFLRRYRSLQFITEGLG